jgi:hypothetical protein
MPLPRPELGLVVHYGFVWSGPSHPSPPDSGKDRPCLIVDLLEVEDLPGRKTLRVTYLPISHNEPRDGESAKLIPARVADYLGLTAEKSYIYTSYACEDDWPFDLAHIPGRRDRFHYGFIPPRLFEAIGSEFRRHLARRRGHVYRR